VILARQELISSACSALQKRILTELNPNGFQGRAFLGPPPLPASADACTAYQKWALRSNESGLQGDAVLGSTGCVRTIPPGPKFAFRDLQTAMASIAPIIPRGVTTASHQRGTGCLHPGLHHYEDNVERSVDPGDRAAMYVCAGIT